MERNQDATLFVNGLDDACTEAILWELFTQAGPVINVHMPKDRITGLHQGYGFIEFAGEEDADYAMKVMNMIKLYGKAIRCNKASAHQKNQDIGANIFIGNLDPDVDEKLLYDTFSSFGPIIQHPKISQGFAFINYGSFEASDSAIEAMNGQYLNNRPLKVSYAFKKDSKNERHGTMIERLLARGPTTAPPPLSSHAPSQMLPPVSHQTPQMLQPVLHLAPQLVLLGSHPPPQMLPFGSQQQQPAPFPKAQQPPLLPAFAPQQKPSFPPPIAHSPSPSTPPPPPPTSLSEYLLDLPPPPPPPPDE